jgi:RNA polymerase sigma-54 factor
MKQNITIKPELKIKQSFNSQKEQSLKILSYNTKDLKEYLCKQAQTNPFLTYTAEADAFLEYDHSTQSLYDKIEAELKSTNQTIPEDLYQYLISLLDSNGYFKTSPSISSYSEMQVQKAIYILQRTEPYGCFCRNLKESLKVQCELSETPASETGTILCDFLEELASHNYDEIIHKTELTRDELEEGFHFIQTLNPKPAANYSTDAPILQAEIKVIYDDKFHFEWINQNYSIQFDDMNHLTKDLRKLRNEAKQLLNTVQKRNMTLLQIMDTLCHIQKDFFISNSPLNYCTLEMVAKECGLHASTISRAINQKGFEFNNKYYPIKYLFCHTGFKEITSEQIKQRIKYLIQLEDKTKPFSDESIKKALAKENIHISRRTITKYREQLLIPCASNRKYKQN